MIGLSAHHHTAKTMMTVIPRHLMKDMRMLSLMMLGGGVLAQFVCLLIAGITQTVKFDYDRTHLPNECADGGKCRYDISVFITRAYGMSIWGERSEVCEYINSTRPSWVTPCASAREIEAGSVRIGRTRNEALIAWVVTLVISLVSYAAIRLLDRSLADTKIGAKTVWVVETATECPICSAPFQVGDSACKTVCGHTFHRKCVDDWMSRSDKCPMCRAPMGELV